jgi:BCD family chlorophyll transporter-like MFS transporter
MGLLATGAFAAQLRLVQFGLAVFGAGFGVFSFGGFSLMAVMTTVTEAGAYLGMWTVVELLFKGLGTFLGGAMRDILVALTDSFAVSYGAIFAVELAGLLIGAWLLARVDVRGWARQTRGGEEPTLEPALLGAEY